jgi:RHS repeat-associated protein
MILLVQLIPASAIAETTKKENNLSVITNDDTAIEEQEKIPQIMEEITEKRGKNVKHFLKSDNTYEAAIYPTTVHYKENGKWKDIDNSLVEVEDSKKNKLLENKANSYKIQLGKNTNSSKLVKIKKGSYEVSWNLVGAQKSTAEIRVDDSSILEKLSHNEHKKLVKNAKSIVDYKEVFPNVDLSYEVLGESIKENIIVKAPVENPIFTFEMKTKDLTTVLNDDKTITFYNDNNEAVFFMDAPFMIDNAGEISFDITLSLEKMNGKKYTLVVTPSNNWLNDPTRKYPIIIDPTIKTSLESEYIFDSYVSENYPTSQYGNVYILKTGYGESSHRNRSFLKFALPYLDTNKYGIISANLTTKLEYSNSSNSQVNLHKVIEDWSENSVSWSNQPSYDNSVVDYAVVNGIKDSTLSWNITDITKDWYEYGNNYGVLLKNNDENVGYTHFYSGDTSLGYKSSRPQVTIEYGELPDTPPAPTLVRAEGNAENSGSGYVELSWEPIQGAAGYIVRIYNGAYYEDFDVGNVTSWSTKNKGIWPTTIEINEQNRYKLHHDGYGTELSDYPGDVYTNAGPTYEGRSNYWFRLKVYNQNGLESKHSAETTPILPDRTRPNSVSNVSVQIEDGDLNSGDNATATISWNKVIDLPIGNSSGVNYYDLQKSIDGGYTYQSIKNVSHVDGKEDYTEIISNLPDNSSVQFRIRAVDKNNNKSEYTYSSEFPTKDRTRPNVANTFTIQPNTWSNEDTFNLSWTGIIDNVGIEQVQYAIDNTSNWIDTGVNTENGSINISSSNLSSTEHKVYIRGVDYEGNTGLTKSAILYKDAQKPSISIQSPKNYETISGITNITGSINDLNISSWKLEYGEGDYPNTFTELVSGTSNVSNQVLYSWDTSDLIENRTYTIKLTAYDSAGNERVNSIKVTKSESATTIYPFLRVNSPYNGEIVRSSIETVSYGQKKTVKDPYDDYPYATASSGTMEKQTYVVGSLSASLKKDSMTSTYEYPLYNTNRFMEPTRYPTDPIYPGDPPGDPREPTRPLEILGKLYINGQLVDEESYNGEGLSFDTTLYEEGSQNFLYVKGIDTQGNEYYSTAAYQIKGISDTFSNTTGIENLSNIILSANQSMIIQNNGSGYYTSGSFESKTVSFEGNINTINISATENKPVGTDINYEVSSDGGLTWQSAILNENIEFASPGSNLKARVTMTSDGNSTPELSFWEIEVTYVDDGQVFTVQLIDEPANLTARPNVNYTTFLSWEKSYTNGVTYNVYRSKTENFVPSEENLVANNIIDPYWNDYNINYGQTFYYKVIALKDFSGQVRYSKPTNEAWAKVVEKEELEKRLGLQGYWGYANFRTGSGHGYINLSNGNLVYETTDFVTPSPRLAMVLRRSYNSQSTTETPLGYGWDFSFNTTLLKEYDVSGNEVGMILKDGDGSIHRFNKKIDGSYETPKGIYMELSYNSSDNTYQIKRNDNITYQFDNRMKLIKFSEPNGNSLDLIYDTNRGNLIEVRNNVGDITYFSYDEKNRLVQVIDPASRIYNFEYDDSSNRLTKSYQIIEGNVEYAEEYGYDDSFAKITSILDPKKNRTDINYKPDSNIVSDVMNAVGESTSFTYNIGSADLTTDKGVTTSFDINENGNISKKVDPLGHETNYEYNNNYLVEHIYYSNIINGTLRTLHQYFSYDEKGNLLTIEDALGNVTEFKNYNSFNQVGVIIAPIDTGVTARTTYNYDSKGNLISSTDPEGKTISYTYFNNGNRKTYTDAFGNTTFYEYDIKDRLSKIVQPLGKTTEILSYDIQGNPTTIKDAKGFATTYKYDLLGRLVEITGPDGNVEKTNYDLNHNVIESTNRRGFSVKYEYDELDRLISTELPDGDINTIAYGYDIDNNEVVTLTDAELRKSTMYYDIAGRLIKEEINGTVNYYDYDLIGNLTRVTDGEGRISESIYDELNRRTEAVIDPGGKHISSQFIYDLMGNVKTVIDGEGYSKKYQYDRIGRLKSVTQQVDGKDVVTSYQYDLVEGKLVKNKVINPLGYEKVTYLDALGRVVKEVDEGNPTDNIKLIKQYEYDLNNNLTKLINNDGTVINYTYNNLNLLEKVQYSDTHFTEFTYDSNGNRLSMFDTQNGQTVQTSYAYNNVDRIQQFVQDGHSVNYEYDGSGNIIKLFYPIEEGDGQKDIEYIYNSNNQLDKILVEGKIARNYAYNAAGQIDYMTNFLQFDTLGSNTIKVDVTYNDIGLTNDISYIDDGTKLEGHTLYYDNRGYITDEAIYFNYDTEKNIVKSFQYDEIGRLKLATTDGNSTAYTYDDLGNRLTMNDGTDTFEYQYNQFNQLTEELKNGAIHSTFSYDLRGNQEGEVTKKNINGTEVDVTTSFSYDLADRLIGVQTSTSNITSQNITNIYNGDGQRIRKEVDGKVTKYFYLGLNLLYTTDVNNKKSTENILDPGGNIIASKRFDGNYDNMYFFYHYDVRGSVTNILDPDALRVKGYTYDEFGNTIDVGDQSFKNEVKYTGAVHDVSTGLYYMNARHYNPKTGRFISQDTYQGNAYDPWTQHLYTYTGNNPINMVDPTGHAFVDIKPTSTGELYVTATYTPPKADEGSTLRKIQDGLDAADKSIVNGLETTSEIAYAGYDIMLGQDLKVLFDGELTYEDIYIGITMIPPFRLMDKTADVYNNVRSFNNLAKSCNCFTAGTQVLTDEGEKNIEDIEVGDKVLAKSEFDENGELAYKEVTALYTNYRNDIIKLYIGDLLIETTDNHPFWVDGRGWVFADELKVGDKLQRADGSNLTIDRVEFVLLDEPVMVYNFTVADYHTYYVTDIGIWVHNTKCGDFSKATFYNQKKFDGHYQEHVVDNLEWGKKLTASQYLAKARGLLTSPVGGRIKGFTDSSGYVFRYNKATNEFAIGRPDGHISTLFKPKDGIKYWKEQVKLYN